LQYKLNTEYFTCDKYKNKFNIYIYSFAQNKNKLGNQSFHELTISTSKTRIQTSV